MSTIGLLFLVGTCMLFPVSIGWIIVCITEHRKEKKYDEFYSIHGVRKHGEVVYYQEEIMRSQNGYVFNIVIKFYDEKNKPHSATLHTNHRSARKYATVKEDEFLCLYDAIIANDFRKYFESLNRKEIMYIPRVVLSAEENFVKTGRKDRLKIAMFVLSMFFLVGLIIFIGAEVSDSLIQKISLTVVKFVPLIAILIPISRWLFSNIHK